MEITWFGHSAFRVNHGNASILIDPFLSSNPAWSKGWEDAAQGATHVLLTHGHDDHVGDSAAILKATGAQLVANFEICMHLVGQGVDPSRINPGNVGGTVDCDGFTTTFVKAEHSSSGQLAGGGNVYLGNPSGLVLHFADAPTLYAMGDTDIFSDMALIQELHAPDIGLVPIGDRFTMGAAVAALACQRYFRFERVIPCHYATFPLLAPDASAFVEAMRGTQTEVLLPQIGRPITI
ncbi:MAG: metal-dependent hydrolase [Rhizobiaceae bacterium]|jgi:L-ascorbate metabolism protein UlaG (beta-lactamase superfamily)|nr:metal-dependent hydrolase [Rhizobiaceae bacterium]